MSEENVSNKLLDQAVELQTLFEIAVKELTAQSVKGNKSAGTRGRKALRALKGEIGDLVKASVAWDKEQ